MIFTLPNCKMKDCQTVKCAWLVCGGAGNRRLFDGFTELGRLAERAESLPDACTRCKEQAWYDMQNAGEASMAELLALGTLGKVYSSRQPAGVQTQHLFPSFYLYFLPPSIL